MEPSVLPSAQVLSAQRVARATSVERNAVELPVRSPTAPPAASADAALPSAKELTARQAARALAVPTAVKVTIATMAALVTTVPKELLHHPRAKRRWMATPTSVD